MQSESFISRQGCLLESSIATMQRKLTALGFAVEERSWLNPVDGIWSVHLRDTDCPVMFTNGKGATRAAALASALVSISNACRAITSGTTITWAANTPRVGGAQLRALPAGEKWSASTLVAHGPPAC